MSYVYYPYNAMYVKVDAFYGNAASAVTVPWAKSQSQINVLEVVGQLLAAALSSGSIGTVFGLVVSTSTLVKTVLYMLMIYNHPRPVEVLPCVNRATPAEAWDFWVLFVLTNGWWIVMPALVVRTLSERLIAATQSS